MQSRSQALQLLQLALITAVLILTSCTHKAGIISNSEPPEQDYTKLPYCEGKLEIINLLEKEGKVVVTLSGADGVKSVRTSCAENKQPDTVTKKDTISMFSIDKICFLRHKTMSITPLAEQDNANCRFNAVSPEYHVVDGQLQLEYDGGWRLHIEPISGDDFDVEFSNLPEEIDAIPIEWSIDARFFLDWYDNPEGKVLLLTDPGCFESSLCSRAFETLLTDLRTGQYIIHKIKTAEACTEKAGEKCSKLPQGECGEALKTIYLKLGNETGIKADKTCITVQGTEDTIMKSAECLRMRFYGLL